MDLHYTLIVEDADVEIPRTIAATLSPTAGTQEFRRPLRPKGSKGPATHWLTSGHLGAQFIELTQDADKLYAVCQQVKLPYTKAQLKGVIDRAVVRPVEEISALALLDELDLEQVTEEE